MSAEDATPENVAATIEIYDDDSESYLEQTDDDFSSDDDVYEARAASGPKRPRTSTSDAPISRRKKRFRFLKLSLESRDRVFSFTHPEALLRLSWTCKELYKALHSRRAESVWKAARLAASAVPQIPACPNDVSELRWAHLLFGPPQCSSCSAANTHTIIFPFRRRVCVPCIKKNTIDEAKFLKLHKESSLLMLLPYTSGSSSVRDRKYWRPDVDKLLATLAVHTDSVTNNVANAAHALEEWKIGELVKSFKICEGEQAQDEWASVMEEDRIQDLRKERKEIVDAKLIEEGWDCNVVQRLNYWPTTNPSNAEITVGAWSTLKKRLEPRLQEIKERQEAIAHEKKNRRQQYMGNINNIATEYTKTLKHRQWYKTPSFAVIYQMEPVVTILDKISAGHQISRKFRKALKQLPSLFSKWYKERKTVLVREIYEHASRVVAMASSPLNLATCVFVCTEASGSCSGLHPSSGAHGIHPMSGRVPFIGVSELFQHERLHQNQKFDPENLAAPFTHVLKFNDRGFRAATLLVESVDLSPGSAVPVSVDEVNARFQCGICVRIGHHSLSKVFMDWRCAISHFIEADDEHHLKPDFVRLPQDQIKYLEGPAHQDRALEARQWACARCQLHCLAHEVQESVLVHLQESHDINPQAAKEWDDYIWAGDLPRVMPSYFSGPLSVVRDMRDKAYAHCMCLLCIPRQRPHQFTVSEVEAHILEVHNVPLSDIKETVHFRRMNAAI